MRLFLFHTCDVFTDRPFAGNPLSIVLGADDLDPAAMQIIAREFNLSETIFVQRPVNPPIPRGCASSFRQPGSRLPGIRRSAARSIWRRLRQGPGISSGW